MSIYMSIYIMFIKTHTFPQRLEQRVKYRKIFWSSSSSDTLAVRMWLAMSRPCTWEEERVSPGCGYVYIYRERERKRERERERKIDRDRGIDTERQRERERERARESVRESEGDREGQRD